MERAKRALEIAPGPNLISNGISFWTISVIYLNRVGSLPVLLRTLYASDKHQLN